MATGEQVTRGQLIGYVGRTGIRMSDPHLHFGLFQGARVLDPRDALAPLGLGAPDRLHELIRGESAIPLRGLVSGSLDLDKMEYLKRASRFRYSL